MNENEKMVNLPNEGYFETKVLSNAILQKINEKKWSIARKGFFFSVGFVLYLIYS